MISNTGIGYIVTGFIVCTAIVSCTGNNKLSDDAVKAVSSTCEKAGMVAHVRLTSSEIKAECVLSAQPAASGVR